MKHLLLLFILLVLSFCTHAQNAPKNEFSIGYFSAGEFFDRTPLKISLFDKGKNVSINYTRLLDSNLSIGLTYARSRFQYLPNESDWYLPFDFTLSQRIQQVFTTNLGYSVSKWSVVVRGKAGIRYNHYSAIFSHSYGEWSLETYDYVNRYGRLGASAGISIAHPIFWRIFGEFDSEYARMFTKSSRNQVLLSYRIGIRF